MARASGSFEAVPGGEADDGRVVFEDVEEASCVGGEVGRVEVDAVQMGLDVGCEGGVEERVLVVEVAVDHRLVASGGGGDSLDAGAGDAVLGELALGGVQESCLGAAGVARTRGGRLLFHQPSLATNRLLTSALDGALMSQYATGCLLRRGFFVSRTWL